MGQEGKCREEETILSCARRLGIGISNVCGGRGTCGTCRIQLISGTLSEPATSEVSIYSSQELIEGWRLACQATPKSDCQLFIPAEAMSTFQRVHVEGLEMNITPEPSVQSYHLKLKAPTLSDQQADVDRIFSTLSEKYGVQCQKLDTGILHLLSPKIRNWKWEFQASVRDDELISLGPVPGRQLGLAVDLGTTTIALYLVDLVSGETLANRGVLNPQIDYGEDIISRMNYIIKSPDEGRRLQKVVIDKLNEQAVELCSEVNADCESIVEAVIVGNTAMHHILLGLPVDALSLSPFTPVVSRALDVKAREIGLTIARGGYVHFPPVIAGFVGSDHVAMLLANNSSPSNEIIIALDIGTNTEISLINGNKITTTSCASGPAFEGGHIKHGIRATKGAIEKIRITGDTVDYQTIDEAAPIGICGSGILDAMAQLYLAGVIDYTGRMNNDNPRVRKTNGQVEFLVAGKGNSTIVVSQTDIRELQLAKAAIRSGIQLLLEDNDYTEEEIGRVVIAGAFGTYIDISSAITIGLLPTLPLERFHQVGNAAGIGAKMSIISRSKREEAQSIAARAHYIELATIKNFKNTFIETSYIGQFRMNHGKREELR